MQDDFLSWANKVAEDAKWQAALERKAALLDEAIEALRLCMGQLRYYPGSTNVDGDTQIDAAYSGAEAILAEYDALSQNQTEVKP